MDTVDKKAEEQAIRTAIMDYYHEGHVTCEPELYLEILHPEWRFFLLDNTGQLRILDRDAYVAGYDPANANPELEWETEFYSIDITERIASVKLRLECQEVRYIDYFNMMKLDGRWWIVHKMSHGVRKSD